MHDGNSITASFDKAAATYDSHSEIQAHIAKTLSKLIKQSAQFTRVNTDNNNAPKILELGCGTGHLTNKLIKDFPNCQLTITDISPQMLSLTTSRLKTSIEADQKHAPQFKILNAETSFTDKSYDLIAASMVIHWFENLPKAIATIRSNLTKDGEFYYSTIAPDCFPEWNEALQQNDLLSGIRKPEALPYPLKQERITIPYGTALDFLKSLKYTGANNPQKDYTPLTPGQLSTAMATLNKNHNGNVTWHIHYGCITPAIEARQ